MKKPSSVLDLTDRLLKWARLRLNVRIARAKAIQQFHEGRRPVAKAVSETRPCFFRSGQNSALTVRKQTGVLEVDAGYADPVTLRAVWMRQEGGVVAISPFGTGAIVGLGGISGLHRCVLRRRPPLVGVIDPMAVSAGPKMASNDLRDVAEGDVTQAARYGFDCHVEGSDEFLAFLRNSGLNVSGCQQAMGALAGAWTILVPGLAIGTGRILVDQVMADEGFAPISPCPGLGPLFLNDLERDLDTWRTTLPRDAR